MSRRPRNDPPEDLRAALMRRSGGHCESCGLAHHARGARDRTRAWHPEAQIGDSTQDQRLDLFGTVAPSLIRIVLTVRRKPDAEDDHDPRNYEHLCQHCYHVRDRHRNVAKRRETLHEQRTQAALDAGQPPLF